MCVRAVWALKEAPHILEQLLLFLRENGFMSANRGQGWSIAKRHCPRQAEFAAEEG